jgi:adenosylcobinamide-GDP ribazoletransferase
VFEALGFLTVLGPSRVPSRRAVVWFGPVGGAIGALLGLLWWGASNVWPPLVAAVLVVVGDLAATGMLHIDGVADAADGLLPLLERERRLAVMASPEVGAFGVAAVAITLLARVAALATADPEGWRAVTLLAAFWCGSRMVMAVTTVVVPYGRVGGLAAPFLGGSAVAVVAASLPFLALAATRGAAGVVALASGLVAGALVVVLAIRRLGGFTGDVLGAAGVMTETAALVVISARW